MMHKSDWEFIRIAEENTVKKGAIDRFYIT